MRRFLQLVLFSFLVAQTANAGGGDTRFVRISPTLSGPSGLLFTQSADTLEPGEIDMGVGFFHEQNRVPDFTLDEISPTLTLGLPWDFELSVRGPYLFFKTPQSKENGFQGTDFTLKWRFLDYSHSYNIPAFGLSLTYYTPSENQELKLVDSWGFKILIVSSAEVILGGRHGVLAGLYADGGVFLRDIGKPTEEKHGLLDLGILFPLTQSNTVHLMLEGNQSFSAQGLEGDYKAITGGLRYVTPSLSLTGGIQPFFRQAKGSSSTNRYIFKGSYLF
jgi:hypothetical protein